MKLKTSDDLNYANYLIDNDLLNQRNHMIWFTKYLMREYSNEHNLDIHLTFLTNLDEMKEIIQGESFSLKRVFMKKDVLGDHAQKNPFTNTHEINIYTGGKLLRKNKTLESLLFTAFHEIGHAIIAKSMHNEAMYMLSLDNFLPHGKKKLWYIQRQLYH